MASKTNQEVTINDEKYIWEIRMNEEADGVGEFV
jgi:hypothetical protein